MIGNGNPAMLGEAKALAMRGWRVLPVNGKIPLVKNWPHLASTDDATLKEWWTRFPDANIGIATGPLSDLFVLDVDPGKGGEDSLRSLETTFGPLPDTIEVLTGGGGRHYYFRHPRIPIGNSASQLGSGLDIKTEGGQVVAPPSVHPNTNRAYEWEAAHHPDDVSLAEVPTWLLQQLTAQPGQGRPFTIPQQIQDGSRDTTLYRMARSLKAKGLDCESIRAALHVENRKKCVPPLPDVHVDQIVENAWTQPDRAAFVQNGQASIPDTTEESAPIVTFHLVTGPNSFITKYIQYAALRTDAPLDAHEALAFGILSALAGPFVTLPIATAVKGWRLTLWLLYLVNSTVGRKSTTLDLAVDVVRTVLGETALIHWEGSPQGLLQRLQTRDGQASVFVRDEYSGLMAGMNRGGHLAGLPQLLIKGFDGSVLENVRTRKRGPDGDTHSDTDRVDSPYLVQFAAAPWDAFTERATIDNVLDGFLARFVMVMGSASERELPMITDAIRTAGSAVYDQARAYADRARSIQQVAIEPVVLARQWQVEQDYRRRAESSARPDAAGPSLKRLAETALKLSALLAIEEDTGTVMCIREAHFLVAVQITDKWAGNALRLVEALGRSSFQRDCEQVLRTITQRPNGIPKGQLYRLHQRLRMRDFEEILSALEAQDRIMIEKAEAAGRGRPAIMVRAIRGAER